MYWNGLTTKDYDPRKISSLKQTNFDALRHSRVRHHERVYEKVDWPCGPAAVVCEPFHSVVRSVQQCYAERYSIRQHGRAHPKCDGYGNECGDQRDDHSIKQ